MQLGLNDWSDRAGLWTRLRFLETLRSEMLAANDDYFRAYGTWRGCYSGKQLHRITRLIGQARCAAQGEIYR